MADAGYVVEALFGVLGWAPNTGSRLSASLLPAVHAPVDETGNSLLVSIFVTAETRDAEIRS